MKIAIVVHGRFHAFDFARALLQRGHEVILFTNYPRWAVKRFDFPSDRVRSFWIHGVLTRGAQKLHHKDIISYPEERFHKMFGRWAAAEIEKEEWDIVHVWSGVSQEIFQILDRKATLKLLMRGSAHISAQAKLLQEEEDRTGIQQDRPTQWIIAREQREYAMADYVFVLSSFAYRTFVEEGYPTQKLRSLPLGAEVKAFRPNREIVEARCQRILSGDPLRVLYVGTLSLRKGIWDIEQIAESLNGRNFVFRFVGPLASEFAEGLPKLSSLAEIVPKQPQAELPKWYAWGDLFVFPTIEDGFAVVLAQANASGLPILTTTNCSGPDFLREGQTGWVLPIRSPESFVDRLRWCDAHRKDLAAMVRRIYNDFRTRDWSEVAADFETICLEAMAARRLGSEKEA